MLDDLWKRQQREVGKSESYGTCAGDIRIQMQGEITSSDDRWCGDRFDRRNGHSEYVWKKNNKSLLETSLVYAEKTVRND